MGEKQAPNNESERSKTYVAAHHNKSMHPIYGIVPQILSGALDDIASIQGFSIGGSYANGKYKQEDDIDLDLLFETYPDFDTIEQIRMEIRRRFVQNGLICELRAPLAKNSLTEHLREGIYEAHPQTPFVVRNEKVAKDWGLSKE